MKQSPNPIAIWRQRCDARRRAYNAALVNQFEERDTY
jgi:hypothetical protein